VISRHTAALIEFYSTVSEDHEAKFQWVVEAITVGSLGKADTQLTPRAKTGQTRNVA
jgi:hypothetical protein